MTPHLAQDVVEKKDVNYNTRAAGSTRTRGARKSTGKGNKPHMDDERKGNCGGGGDRRGHEYVWSARKRVREPFYVKRVKLLS